VLEGGVLPPEETEADPLERIEDLEDPEPDGEE
jgi:hypothetical protein